MEVSHLSPPITEASQGQTEEWPFEPGLTFQPLVHTCHSFPLSRPLSESFLQKQICVDQRWKLLFRTSESILRFLFRIFFLSVFGNRAATTNRFTDYKMILQQFRLIVVCHFIQAEIPNIVCFQLPELYNFMSFVVICEQTENYLQH